MKPEIIEMARRRLLPFCHLVNPAFISSRHHYIIAKHLQIASREPKRYIFSMPPRHGKTFTITQHFPAWFLGNYPTRNVISVSYGQELASGFGRYVRNLMQTSSYAAIFDTQVSMDSKSKKTFNTIQGGSYFAVGKGGPITGRGADIAIVDDLIKNEKEARSELNRQSIKDWYNQTLYTRLMPGASIIVVATRWHEDDLTGWLLKESKDKWEEIKMPAISDDNQALWPEMYDLEELEKKREAIGSYAFESLYQQNPTEPEGQIIKKKWIKRWEVLPPLFHDKVMSWDLAFKGTDTSDYVVGQVWGRLNGDYYLLDQVKARMDFSATITAFKELVYKHPDCIKKVVEDAANGAALYSELQRHIPGIILWKPKTDKIGRVHAVSPLYEAGNVFVPLNTLYDWVEPMLNEWFSFPHGKNDDTVDAMTQALLNINQASSSFVMGLGSSQY